MDKNILINKLMDVSQNKSGLDTLIDVLGMAHSDGKNNEANYKPKIARTYKPAWKVKGANFYYCIKTSPSGTSPICSRL